MTHVVYSFCREAGERYMPSKGFGAGQQSRPSYHRPTSRGGITRHIGEGFRKQNHWLDALYNASAAGHYCGARLVEEPTKPKQRISLAEYAMRAKWENAPSAQELKDMYKRRT